MARPAMRWTTMTLQNMQERQTFFKKTLPVPFFCDRGSFSIVSFTVFWENIEIKRRRNSSLDPLFSVHFFDLCKKSLSLSYRKRWIKR
ncbi:unnamed protein product [Cylicostephanus goldi]|uniref:Uncharacterized protein n=1 Tax=Cylicostephanus goldi TaxID=71465 RepID=A0A3P6S925_CYLGO|nr:unnamed protein product [Cylicostephanus goldi]